MRQEAEQWLEQARADLGAARDNLKTENWFVAAFLSQQSAEKALKALYIEEKRRESPAIHSLLQLGDMVNVPQSLRTILRELSPPYIAARYPSAATGVPVKFYDKETALKLVSSSEEVLKWVLRRLPN